MRIIDHVEQEREQWRPGVLTRMRVSAVTGAAQLCIFEQWCDPGCGAPTHLHAVERCSPCLPDKLRSGLVTNAPP
jgi:hypothetical protein